MYYFNELKLIFVVQKAHCFVKMWILIQLIAFLIALNDSNVDGLRDTCCQSRLFEGLSSKYLNISAWQTWLLPPWNISSQVPLNLEEFWQHTSIYIQFCAFNSPKFQVKSGNLTFIPQRALPFKVLLSALILCFSDKFMWIRPCHQYFPFCMNTYKLLAPFQTLLLSEHATHTFFY